MSDPFAKFLQISSADLEGPGFNNSISVPTQSSERRKSFPGHIWFDRSQFGHQVSCLDCAEYMRLKAGPQIWDSINTRYSM